MSTPENPPFGTVSRIAGPPFAEPAPPKFAKAMGNNVENFAFVNYDGQVTAGFTEPANTTTSVFAGYKRVAANDLLTQWTPALPPVLP